jgi:uncharacterized protein YdiU (UPF0061 family)
MLFSVMLAIWKAWGFVEGVINGDCLDYTAASQRI